MSDLEKRLKAFDAAKEKIIHESYLQEEKKIEDDLRHQVEKLEKSVGVEQIEKGDCKDESEN